MPNAPKWFQEDFSSSISGGNSNVAPDMLSPSTLAWGYNIANRGGRPRTRPYFRYRMALPDGHVQGASYFSIQNGMGVVMIDGSLYRLRIAAPNAETDSYESIPLDFENFPTSDRVWMCQTVESLIIQNGLDNPIIYDGSTATRSNPAAFGVPRGRQMAYGNGRLWVATDKYTLVAGNIRDYNSGSELQFTETNDLNTGGSFTFSEPITALSFMATTGTSDYGSLMVFCERGVFSVRADVTARDQWREIPQFITIILRNVGGSGQNNVVEVNQDIYWRDPEGGIRSVRSALADESGSGNAPISYEVSRLTEYDTKSRLEHCPAIQFNNRLLVGSSPFVNSYGRPAWKSLIALDFAPISTMQGKMAPEYDCEWSGLSITHMFTGRINGKPRAFAIATAEDGSNALWEIMSDTESLIADKILDCATQAITDLRPTSYIETARRDFGNSLHRKRLMRVDVFISYLLGRADMTVEYRADNAQKWRAGGNFTFCAQVNDPVVEGETSHVWKNLNAQHRAQVKTFAIPIVFDPISKRATNTGFQFQFRISWRGHLTITRVVANAIALDEPEYSQNVWDDVCVPNDVT